VRAAQFERSLSLDMQSSALALDAFGDLVVKLERGHFAGRPQPANVERLVFPRHDRPRALCALDLGDAAEQLDCLIRACDFGEAFASCVCLRTAHRGPRRRRAP
jgi:hypothetical protein